MRYRVSKFSVNKGKYNVVYNKHGSTGIDEQYSFKSEEKPRPDFITAYTSMKDLLLSKFSAFKFTKKMVQISGIEFKYGGQTFFPEEISGFKVKGYITNKNSDVCVFATKWLDVDADMANAIGTITQELEAYIEGDRAQGRLFEQTMDDLDNQEENEDLDFDDADDIEPYENDSFDRAARGFN